MVVGEEVNLVVVWCIVIVFDCLVEVFFGE